MKKLLLGVVVSASIFMGAVEAAESKVVKWSGKVTAVNSNGNKPGRSFTAVDSEGRIKMFYIESLTHLDINDRVVLRYIESQRFPLNVTTIKFLPPKG